MISIILVHNIFRLQRKFGPKKVNYMKSDIKLMAITTHGLVSSVILMIDFGFKVHHFI